LFKWKKQDILETKTDKIESDMNSDLLDPDVVWVDELLEEKDG